MNERIKELYNKVVDDDKLNRIFYFDSYLAGKFAELIVEECAQVCLDQRDPANLNYKPSVKFAEAINQHFGVEQ